MKNYFVYIFITLLSLCGCKKNAANKETGQPVSLLKTVWILSSIQNTKTNEILNFPDDGTPRESIVFTDSLNVFFVSSTCNGCQGKYFIFSSNDSVKITGLICTAIYCKYYQWETYLINNLDSIFQYKINNGNLTVYSKGTYNLIFSSIN